ncbi:MAG: hypothetical protein L6262_04875 [Weeksellaceae bacterium]|nr:hypothetical protein [Weeksellaceae bacterium]
MELLENVIKSNERNIASNEMNMEQSVNVRFDIEDLTRLIQHILTVLREVKAHYDGMREFNKIEQAKRAEFLAHIPTEIKMVLAPETIDYYESFRKKIIRMEKFIWTGIGTVVFGIFIVILSINFATNWYKESIKSKSELRQDILNEIASEGKKIYDEKEIKILNDNTRIMQTWINHNPKEAEGFLKFKDGFEASSK